MKVVVYDIEIIKAIPSKNPSERVDDVDYCEGWDDHANMGVSCVGALQLWDNRPRLFFGDNRQEFGTLMAEADVVVGFNNVRFDDVVLRACDWPIAPETARYDLLRELMTAKRTTSFAGLSLSACCMANFGADKTGWGGAAPIDFQKSRYGLLTDYCLNDVWLTARLIRRVMQLGFILDPKDTSKVVRMPCPQA